MAHAFVDPFWNQEKDPYMFQQFWDRHKDKLMDWWLNDEPLNCDEPAIQLSKIEERLFFRPELWWIFEAKKPLKHYMVTRGGRPREPPKNGFKDEFCEAEDEGLYLKRHGLLSEIEQAAWSKYEPNDYSQEDGYSMKEVSRYLVSENNHECSCFKCHIDVLDWRTKLGFAYGLEGTGRLREYLNQEEYLKVNEGNPYS